MELSSKKNAISIARERLMSSQVPFGNTHTTTKSPDLQVKADDWHDEPLTFRDRLMGMMPPTISLLVHTAILLLLAVVTYEEIEQEAARFIAIPAPDRVEDPPVEVELDPEIDVVLDNVALFNSAPAPVSAASAAANPGPVVDGESQHVSTEHRRADDWHSRFCCFDRSGA